MVFNTFSFEAKMREKNWNYRTDFWTLNYLRNCPAFISYLSRPRTTPTDGVRTPARPPVPATWPRVRPKPDLHPWFSQNRPLLAPSELATRTRHLWARHGDGHCRAPEPRASPCWAAPVGAFSCCAAPRKPSPSSCDYKRAEPQPHRRETPRPSLLCLFSLSGTFPEKKQKSRVLSEKRTWTLESKDANL